MDDLYLKEAIGAIKTYAKMINDYYVEDKGATDIIENTWYYYEKEGSLIVTLIIKNEKKELIFKEEEWKKPDSNMLGNVKLNNLYQELAA